MTIHLHLIHRIAKALFRAVSRRRYTPCEMDYHFFADIGLSQCDIIASHIRRRSQ
jgi:hypothetical protein